MHIVLLKCASRSDCIFEIHQLWQSDFSRVYSNCCYSCSFEAEIIKIGQSSNKMYCNKILNFQESTTILNACTKKKTSGNLLNTPTYLSRSIQFRWCSRGVMVKAMDCGIVVCEFELQSRYYAHLCSNALGKGMNPPILPAMS